MKKLGALLITLSFTFPALAQNNQINLSDLTKRFFPSFNRASLNLVSQFGLCRLKVRQEYSKTAVGGSVITFELIQGISTHNTFSNDVILTRETKLDEAAGRGKDEGYYTYTSFYTLNDSVTLTKGLFYYTPSFDPVDSSDEILQEQKITFEQTTAGVTVKFKERAPQSPKQYNCVF